MIADSLNHVTTFANGAQGNLLTITDPWDLAFLMKENSPDSGRVLRQTQADGGVWRFWYQLSGVQVTGPGCPVASGSLVVAVRLVGEVAARRGGGFFSIRP